MSLCDLCKDIPWESLPEVPPHLSMNSTGHKYIQPLLRWPKGPSGHPHHQSLEALKQSASSCSLCQIIYSSAEKVQAQLEELKPKWEAKETIEYEWPTYELFIVKRREGGDGCWVMSFVGGDSERTKRREEKGVEEAWIIAALGLCVRDGDPLAELIEGRAVEDDARSQTVAARCRKWLQNCEAHPTCTPAQTLLPSRILDVGELDSPKVHLLDPVPEGTVGKYVSLSYCWGSPVSYTTTRATMEERKAGINISDIPATYQDAIWLTRQLGLRYLWIDSLCIYQDDLADWERESAKMLSIYSNAYLTVCAARATQVSDGFLNSCTSRNFVELDHTRNEKSGKVLAFTLPLREELIKRDYINMPHEPLSKRAWGLQERVLSHRIMLFCSDQIYFECNEGFRGEDGLNLDFRHPCAHKSLERDHEFLSPHYKDLPLNERPKKNILSGWYELLWLYGPKKLTHASDKLPAISGIASLYAEKIGEEYLAGLWRGQLIEGLMWQSLKFRRVSEYRAPSWSWASGDGIPATGQIVDYTELAEIIDAKVTLKGENPFGEVTDGWIKLRAPLEQLYLNTDGWNPEAKGGFRYDNNIKVRTKNGDAVGAISRFDFAYTADDAHQEAKKIVKSLEGVDIYALFILKGRLWEANASEDDGAYHALIVRKKEGTENYQRLGFVLAEKKEMGREPEKEDKDTFPIITLV